MTKSQAQALNSTVKGWERTGGKITVLGETNNGNIICELETNTFTQKFTIGKRGSHTWKYKYPKI